MIRLAENDKKAIELMYQYNYTYHGNIHFGTKTSKGFRTMGYSDINSVSRAVNKLKLYKSSDYYITSNTTFTGERKASDIFSFNNIVIDIDCHDKSKNSELDVILDELVYRIQRDLYTTHTIPTHNILVRTGRGIQLWWCINQISSKLEWLYNVAQKRLILALEDVLKDYAIFSCLTLDKSSSISKIGFYRLPGTYNTAANKRVETSIEKDERYDINDLIQMVSDIKEEKQSFIKKVINRTFKGLHHARIEYIREATKSKTEQRITEGYRNNFAWLYYNACYQIYIQSDADQMLDELNSQFIKPLKTNEIRAIKKYIQSKGGLRMKQSTFFELLGENPNIKTRAMVREEKKQEKNNRNNAVKKLYKNGKTVKEICHELNLSKPTVLKILNIRILKESRNALIRKAKAAGKTLKQIADEFKVSLRTIQRILKEEVNHTATTPSVKEKEDTKQKAEQVQFYSQVLSDFYVPEKYPKRFVFSPQLNTG